MKQDIRFSPVAGVSVAIVPDEHELPTWTVYLLNSNNFSINTVLISAEGYGTQPTGETVRTSTLRYHFGYIAPQSTVPIELIDSAVFHLTSQYWVSYYVDGQIFDKKFLFVPGSITPDHLVRLELLDGRLGILHS